MRTTTVTKSAAPTATRAVLYLRSARDPEGLAVERQRDACQHLAREAGWTVVGEYADNAAGWFNAIRPGFDQMAADYTAGQFDAIVCYDLDRLTRQPLQMEEWINAEGRGLRLLTIHGEVNLTTDAGRLYARAQIGGL